MSANETPNEQFLPAHHMPKGVLSDLNKSKNHIQNGYTNYVDACTIFSSQILHLCAGMANKDNK
jgi:hypothetical protein